MHHDRRSYSVSLGRWIMAAVIIAIITVNNCCCSAFQSPAIIQRSTGLRIQHVVSAIIVGRALCMVL